ncbi:MAG: putative ABC transport system permease protein [Candidatus Latescibacterota bacterium]|jgi:putative ABC transport system permease protein
MVRAELMRMGLEGLSQHRLRSILTMLGVIFGVASVIAMLAIGEGAKREALKKFKALGVNNIIVRDKNLSDTELEEVRAKFSSGLSIADADAIRDIVPSAVYVAPQTEHEIDAKRNDKSIKVTLIGVDNAYQTIFDAHLASGHFLTLDHHKRELRVCVLGADAARELFPIDEPLGKQVKLDDQWFEVVAVMASKALFTETVGELAARNLNQDIYIPLSSFLRRFSKKKVLASQIDQLTVQVTDSDRLLEASAVIRRILTRRHHNNEDFDIVVPFELLKQEEHERQIYNMVLGSIAAISLLVGGIGIMNIMLATVLERTREIGIRRALGAKQREIMSQFLIEAVGLSLIGGLVGVFLGVGMALFIDAIADFKTVISPLSVIASFGLSGIVGILSGTFPARRAARVNPIEALRYE